MTELKDMATFGVAGNFTGHLEQAGEARDFTNVKTAEEHAPKAMFPTYFPKARENGSIPRFLTVFPFDAERLWYPAGEEKVQIEPECAVIFRVKWEGDTAVSLQTVSFGASNDCSIRKEGAKKISLKKNWGEASKGFSSQWLPAEGGILPGGIFDRYRIASFLIRDGVVTDYGEDSAVRDYSYFYGKLTDWLIDRMNHQENEGPAEDIHTYLLEAGKPEYILVSVGATRYTEFGRTNFLRPGDKAAVVVYPEDRYTNGDIRELLQKGIYEAPEASFLVQTILEKA